MDSLVNVAWLKANLDAADLCVLDCTVAFELSEDGRLSFYSGRDDWAARHIPRSAFADILGDLSNTASPYQFTLPDAASFGAAMARLGVGEGRRVVLYDATFSMWATRVWWMLNAFGFSEVAVLDGGLTAWQAAQGEVTDVVEAPRPGHFEARLQGGWFVDTDAVANAVADPGSSCLIDALMPEMYNGEQAPYQRPGHIPGAINVPAVGVVDADSRLFLSDDVLRQRFADALADPNQPVITYCGGGIAATADAFLLRRLGKTRVTVYDGSMAEWTADPNRPLVMGRQAR